VSIRDEVRASAAAHNDLGPGYDTALAEGLVERIGEEIDKRIDARLFGQPPYPPGQYQPGQYPPGQYPQPQPQPYAQRPSRWHRDPGPGRIGFGAVVLGLGSMGLGIGATAAVLHPGDPAPGAASAGAEWLIVLIWLVIAAINLSYARRR
jgi:hypothetical protein